MRRIAFAAVAMIALVSLAEAQQPLPPGTPVPKGPKYEPPPALKLFAKEPAAPLATDTELRKLQKFRYAAMWKNLALNEKYMAAGSFDENTLFAVGANGERLVAAFLATEPTREATLEFLTNYLEYVSGVEKIMRLRFNVGSVREQSLQIATYYRIDAEIQLLKAKEASTASGTTIATIAGTANLAVPTPGVSSCCGRCWSCCSHPPRLRRTSNCRGY